MDRWLLCARKRGYAPVSATFSDTALAVRAHFALRRNGWSASLSLCAARDTLKGIKL